MATRYLILGAGRFGRLACERLRGCDPEAQICLVDHDRRTLPLIQATAGLLTVAAKAAPYLADCLTSDDPPDWVIPAVPWHVAFEWLLRQQPEGEVWRQVSVLPAVGRNLPFCHHGASGEVYLSLSTRQCPDDCPEPADRCFLTGLPRSENLYDYLANLSLQEYSSVVICSRQLAPGVGGYRPADLWQLLRQVLRGGSKILISTACRCHGVTHALKKLTEREAVIDI